MVFTHQSGKVNKSSLGFFLAAPIHQQSEGVGLPTNLNSLRSLENKKTNMRPLANKTTNRRHFASHLFQLCLDSRYTSATGSREVNTEIMTG